MTVIIFPANERALSPQSFNYAEDINDDISFVDENESIILDCGDLENDDLNDDNFSEDQYRQEFVNEISNWAVEFVSAIPLAAITALLKILRKYTEVPFPKMLERYCKHLVRLLFLQWITGSTVT